MTLMGEVNGQAVSFQHRGSHWETALPKTLTGRFVVELMAVDDAGNSSRYATVLMTVDRGTVQVTMLPDAVAGQLLREAYQREVLSG